MSDQKKTAGQIVLEHDALGLETEDDVREYTRAMSPKIAELLLSTAQQAKNHDLYRNKDFYIVSTKRPDPVLRYPITKVWARRSCPTPVYRQDVYKYHHGSGVLTLLWSIPDRYRCQEILKNQNHYLQDKDWKDISKTVILMASGELLNWVKKENGEKQDAVIIISPREEMNA